MEKHGRTTGAETDNLIQQKENFDANEYCMIHNKKKVLVPNSKSRTGADNVLICPDCQR